MTYLKHYPPPTNDALMVSAPRPTNLSVAAIQLAARSMETSARKLSHDMGEIAVAHEAIARSDADILAKTEAVRTSMHELVEAIRVMHADLQSILDLARN